MLRKSKSDSWLRLSGIVLARTHRNQLPSQREVLAVFMHHHKLEIKLLKRAALLAKEVIVFSEKARI